MSHQECNIPVAFVPLNFTNDPETEDLIFGDELTEGMVVLLGGMTRFNPDNYVSSNCIPRTPNSSWLFLS